MFSFAPILYGGLIDQRLSDLAKLLMMKIYKEEKIAGGHRGLEEECSHDTWAAWVRIPPILTLLIFSDFEEQLEKSIAIAKVHMKGRKRRKEERR